jgi:type I restriction enzyme, S subunit
LRFYRAQDLTRDGRIADDNVVHVEMPDGMTTRAVVGEGDILVVITGATIGRTAVVHSYHEPGLVSQHVGLVRVNKAKVNPRFLHYCILAPAWAGGQLNEAKYGQGKPGLNLANLRALRFPLRPLPEQERIVAHLDRVTAKVDALKQLQAETAAELDALLPSVLDKAFRGEL